VRTDTALQEFEGPEKQWILENSKFDAHGTNFGTRKTMDFS